MFKKSIHGQFVNQFMNINVSKNGSFAFRPSPSVSSSLRLFDSLTLRLFDSSTLCLLVSYSLPLFVFSATQFFRCPIKKRGLTSKSLSFDAMSCVYAAVRLSKLVTGRHFKDVL